MQVLDECATYLCVCVCYMHVIFESQVNNDNNNAQQTVMTEMDQLQKGTESKYVGTIKR